jgi:fatty-acyl-CoA synthase
MANLTEFLSFHGRRTPDKTALIYEGMEISYGEMALRARAGARWLEGQGVRPGDVVALLMKNSAAFLDLTFAISHRGAVLLPMNYRLSVNEIAYILADAGAKLLFVDEEFGDSVLPLAREAVEAVVLVSNEAQADIRALTGPDDGPAKPFARTSSDLMRLVYTSGTTSRPKGVLHAYDQFYWKHLSAVPAMGLSDKTRLLTVGPLYHVGGLELPGLSIFALGGTMVLEREFDPERSLDAINRYSVNGAWFAPTMSNMILALPPASWAQGKTLDWVIGGGERTPEARILAFAEAFPDARYVDAYGLTESNGGDTFMEPGRELEKIGSVGRAVPHLDVSIRDDDGRAADAGVSGEICLRGPKITAGYWNDADKTREAFFEDGWFRTGDVGHLDDEEFLYLTDRKKDMILSGGENIASSEVERVIYDMPEVLEAAVVAAPDTQWGEVPVAVIALRPGSEVTLEAIQAHCRRSLAGFKLPKRLVLKDALPRNPSGKVLKRDLRDEIAKEQ